MYALNSRSLALVQLFVLAGCGTADPNAPGRCVTSSASGYVAAATDTNTKNWSFEIRPSNVTVLCRNPASTGVVQVIGTVRDGQRLPISSVSVGAAVSEFGGLRLVTDENLGEILDQFKNLSGTTQRIVASDKYTDNCGVALFTVFFTCPSEAGLSVGGSFVAYSGALFSDAVTIQAQLSTPPTPGPTQAPAAPVVVPTAAPSR